MKWYFCIDEYGTRHEIGAWASIAVQSALAKTDLSPHCLIDGPIDGEFSSHLRKLGVDVRQCKTRIAPAIEDAHAKRSYPRHALGAFLRAEVPDQAESDEFVLYTDCDVVFWNKIDLSGLEPRLLAVGPRQNLYDFSHFNSGVLLFNVEAFRSTQDAFFDFASNNLGPFLPGVDEPIFNKFFAGKFDQLPVGMNWRPFFGYNNSISLLHFHGPKILHLVQYVTEGPRTDWGDAYARVLSNLIGSSLPAYYRYICQIADSYVLPDMLAYQMERFMKYYPRFNAEVSERFGEASLNEKFLHISLGSTINKKNKSIAALVKCADTSMWRNFKYTFRGNGLNYPNLLIKLFSEETFGIVRSVTASYLDGREPYRVELESIGVDGQFVEFLEGGFFLASSEGAASLVLGPNSIPERRGVQELTLECSVLGAGQAYALFADGAAKFFEVNRIECTIEAAVSSSDHYR